MSLSTTPSDRIAVAIVNYNTRDHLRRCLDSLVTEAMAGITVVDNGSVDGSIEMVEREFPGIELIVDRSNPGYGASANLAISRSATPYVLLLNSDTIVRPGLLAAIADYLDGHPHTAVLGPRLENPDGSLQPSCFPFIGTVQLELELSLAGPLLARVPLLRDRYLLHHWAHDRPRVVPWVLGAVLAFRREAFDAVDGFDARYFLYAEEVDLCYRVAQAGWEVRFAPVGTVVHVGGASTAPAAAAMEVQRVASALRFCRIHYSPARVAWFTFMVRAGALGRLMRARVSNRFSRDSEHRERLSREIDELRTAYAAIRRQERAEQA